MAKWYRIPFTLRVTEKEYRANMEGINIVFGAVLGFVLAGAEAMSNHDFMLVLLLSSAVVVSILYLGSTEYTLFYGVSAVTAVVLLPEIMDALEIAQIPKLQPTLGVWTGMVILIETMPRRKEEAAGTN